MYIIIVEYYQLSGKVHIKNILMKRFLSFISHIERSPKSLPLTLRKSIRHDARSTAGSNLSNIMLLFDKVSIDDIRLNDIDNFEYSPSLPENQWVQGKTSYL